MIGTAKPKSGKVGNDNYDKYEMAFRTSHNEAQDGDTEHVLVKNGEVTGDVLTNSFNTSRTCIISEGRLELNGMSTIAFLVIKEY